MVAIKDMEMPKSCKECKDKRIDHITFELCLRTGRNVVDCKNHRHCDCPLVEIEERKVGKWIRVDHTKVKCSNCDITHLIAQYPHGVIDYCPNCGSYNQSIIEEER